MQPSQSAKPTREWQQLARAMAGLHAQDRAVLVSVLRELVRIEALHGPDVAEAALENLILRIGAGGLMLPN